MLLTLGEAKADRGIRAIIGVSPTSQDFADYCNAAARKALRRGDWPGTVVPIHVCVKRGCVVWPRYVAHVRKLNLCGQPVSIRNQWYEYLSGRDRECWWGWIGSCWGDYGMNAKGYSPVHTDIFGDGRTVRAYHQLASDLGKTITIFGLDNNNQPLRRNNGDGTWSDGITLRFQLPYVETAQYVRAIHRIVKDETQGNITLFAYDSVNLVLEDLAVYEPSETNPEYEKYQLSIPGCVASTTGTTDCSTSRSVVALVKLKFIPAKVDTDLVYIQNPEALKLFIQSIKSGEAGDREAAIGYEKDAIRELNLDIYNQDQDDQTSIDLGELGGSSIGSQRCF